MSDTHSPTTARATTWPLRATAATLAVLGIVPLANLLTSEIAQPWWTPAVRIWTWWGGGILLLALCLGAAFDSRIERLAARAERVLIAPGDAVFMTGTALAAALLALGFSWWMFHWQAITIDEYSQQFQGKLLALGHLSARAESHGEFFSTLQTAEIDGRFFSQFPIGGAALKALGFLIGQPWSINPLLLGIAVIAIYRFFAKVGSERDARITVLLLAVSPFVLFIAASQLDHVAALCAVWIAFAAVARWLAADDDSSRARAAALIGAALGVAAAIRPYDAVVYGVAIGVFQLVHVMHAPGRLRSLSIQLLAGMVPVIALLVVNHVTTGHAFTFAYDVVNGPEHRPGFHLAPLGFPHTPRRGLMVVSMYLMKLDLTLFGWAIPALLFVVAALAIEHRPSRWDHLMLGACGIALVAYWLYWGEGFFAGPRFLYPLAPVFVYYTARLPVLVRERVAQPVARAAVVVLYPLLLLACWLAPADVRRPVGARSMAARTREWSNANDMLVSGVARLGLHHAIVFVSDGWHARLSARLRALGARPFMAQRIVGNYDACLLQRALDHADSLPTPSQRAGFVFGLIDQSPTARPVPNLTALQQLAFTPSVPVPARCAHERQWAMSNGLDLARLLPRNGLDSLGRIGGDVVFARDFGPRDTMLRDRFGDRSWFVARVDLVRDSLRLTLQPLQPSQPRVN